MNRLRATIMFGVAVGCAVGIAPSGAHGADPPTAPATCPGPTGTPTCPQPTAAQCGDYRGSYAPPPASGGQGKDAACYQAWKANCACQAQQKVDAIYQNHRAKDAERRPSPSRGVVPADTTQQNGVRIKNYGLDTSLLTSKQAPAVKGAPVSRNISDVPVQTQATDTTPHKAPNQYSKNFGAPGNVAVPNNWTGAHAATRVAIANGPTVKPSTQFRWVAQETLARAQAAGVCADKTTLDDRVQCATKYIRPLGAAPPKISSTNTAQACYDFVYNRYYDVERWVDRTNACGHDNQCKAAITLDPNNGIAGKWLSGSDVKAESWQTVQNFYREAFKLKTGKNTALPDCDVAGLTGDTLQICEGLRSMPPVALVRPMMLAPIAGGGFGNSWMTQNGVQNVASAQDCSTAKDGACWAKATGYWVSRNAFYDDGGLFTPLLASVFQGDATKFASVQRLMAAMHKGQNYYYVGAPT
jgi:hypothetical protein